MIDSNNQNYGISEVGLLTIVFVVLKLTNVIAWSWWWVLSPIWISIVLAIIIIGIYLFVMYIIIIFKKS